MNAPAHVGILAHSADGAALCFLEMIREAARRCGDHVHPEITLSILPMGPTLDAYARDDLDTVRAYLAGTAARLADAGCDFFVCPDNTAHAALEREGAALPLPGLHIAEIVAAKAQADGRRCVGLLGTAWTMEGPVYPAAFRRHDLTWRTPAANDRAIVHDVILRELTQGVISAASRDEFIRIIELLRAAGCDAVALSCTEIPLLVSAEISPLPVLDSTRLLAREAVACALEHRVPAWRGGSP